MKTIDLSCDLGEALSEHDLEVEDSLWPLITSANIACGGHVGDPDSMRRAVRNALRHGVAIGAHPSYPDRVNFGRKSMQMGEAVLKAALHSQLSGFATIVAEEGGALLHAKPHGALYNDAHQNAALARIIALTCADVDGRALAIVTSPGSAVQTEATLLGGDVILEGFADRRYMPDGSLQPRSDRGSLILDFGEAASQGVLLAGRGVVIAVNGAEVEVPCRTICVHSDMTGARERLLAIRSRLERDGFTFAAPGVGKS